MQEGNTCWFISSSRFPRTGSFIVTERVLVRNEVEKMFREKLAPLVFVSEAKLDKSVVWLTGTMRQYQSFAAFPDWWVE